jgi:hypothetical protein
MFRPLLVAIFRWFVILNFEGTEVSILIDSYFYYVNGRFLMQPSEFLIRILETLERLDFSFFPKFFGIVK